LHKCLLGKIAIAYAVIKSESKLFFARQVTNCCGFAILLLTTFSQKESEVHTWLFICTAKKCVKCNAQIYLFSQVHFRLTSLCYFAQFVSKQLERNKMVMGKKFNS